MNIVKRPITRGLLLFLFSLAVSLTHANELRINKGKVTIDFTSSAVNHPAPYTIQRSMGRFG